MNAASLIATGHIQIMDALQMSERRICDSRLFAALHTE
jgi:hypothetical protein